MIAPPASAIGQNLTRIQDRVAAAAHRCGRSVDEITIVGISKTVTNERVEQAIDAGIRVLGENRVQEAAGKIPSVTASVPVSWHFVGSLQRNKARTALDLFDVIQSVDTLKLAMTLSRLAEAGRRRPPVLLEVNVSGERSKSGFTSDDLLASITDIAALPGIKIQGLMTIGPLTHDPRRIRASFQSLRSLRDQLAAAEPRACWDTLSMGMSDDFEIAIEEGATMIRVGRALFGGRP